jgi:MtN3 and saliva related transmembrane protein
MTAEKPVFKNDISATKDAAP